MIENSARKLLEKHLHSLSGEGIKISPVKVKDYNFETAVSSGDESLKVLVFFGRKGIKTILQGNRESSLYKKVNSILFGDELFASEEITEPESYIGIDESGKGDYFGPLVIGGVFINNQLKNELVKTGVKDSKQ